MAQSNEQGRDELREQIQGMIYDKAIQYSNGHVVDFYNLADEIITVLAIDRKQHEQAIYDRLIGEAVELPMSSGDNMLLVPLSIIEQEEKK